MSLLKNPPQEWGYFETSGDLVKPAVNMIDNGNEFIVEVMAPGMSLQDFGVTVQNQQLWIEGFRNDRDWNKKRDIHREFPHEHIQFRRLFELGNDIKTDDFKTVYQQGILKIIFSKQQAKKVHQN